MKYDFETIINRYEQGAEKWLTLNDYVNNNKTDIIPFSIADMEFKLAPEIKKGLIEYLENDAILGYTKGTEKYYNAIVDWMKNNHNWNIEKEWICVSNGVIPALFDLVKAYTDKDDGVIIMSPVYYPFFSAIEANNRCIVDCPLIDNDMHYEINYNLLEEYAKNDRNKLLILCNPHNPVGRVWKRDELIKIADICIKNNVLIISDEIHNDIIMPGFAHTVLASINEEISNNVITCTSPSKTFNLAGVQVSNIIIKNDKLRNLYLEEQARSGFDCMGVFAYQTCILAYNKCFDWYQEFIKTIYNNYLVLKDYIEKNLPKIKVYSLEGTYLVWLDFRNYNLSKEDLEDKMHRSLAFMDEGYLFGNAGEGFERINIACPTNKIIEVLERIKKNLI